jgi:hypothetical protein
MESYGRKSKREFWLLVAFHELFDLASSLNRGLNPRQVLAPAVPEEAPRTLVTCAGTISGAIAEGKNRRSKAKGNLTWSR